MESKIFSKDPIHVCGPNGEPVGQLKGGFLGALLPLIGSIAGPILNKIFGHGVHIQHKGIAHHKKMKGGDINKLVEHAIMEHLVAGQGVHHHHLPYGTGIGSGIGFGATAQGYGFSKGEIAYPKGSGRKKRVAKKGGFAVDQAQTKNYTGFTGYQGPAFPINSAIVPY